MRSWRWSPHEWDQCLIGRGPTEVPHPLPCENTVRRCPLQTRKLVLIRHWICWSLDLDFPSLQTVRYKFLWFISHPPSLWWLRHLPGMKKTQACIRKIPWRRKWRPTPVFLCRESHGQRSLTGYSPWGLKRTGHHWATNTSTFSPSLGILV